MCFLAKLANGMGSPCNPGGTRSNVTDDPVFEKRQQEERNETMSV